MDTQLLVVVKAPVGMMLSVRSDRTGTREFHLILFRTYSVGTADEPVRRADATSPEAC